MSLTDVELTRFFFALVALLISAHCFGYLAQKIKIPRVIGEIFGGLLLGPTILGHFFPAAYDWIFQAFEAEGKLISALYWMGLVLLMFISGFEIQRTVNKNDRKLILAVLIGGTVLPFIIGWFLPQFFDFSLFIGEKQNLLAFTITLGIAIAVTSIPVISKIFLDLNIMQTRFAKIIIATATLEDILLWVALAVATGLVSSAGASTQNIVYTVLITITFFAVGFFLLPRLVQWANRSRFNVWLKSSRAGYSLLICFFLATLASILHINIVFGAFLAGIIIGSMPSEKFIPVRQQIKDISVGFFVPIYFAVVGWKLDLIHHFNLNLFLLFIGLAILIKVIGTFIAAYWSTKDWSSSLNIAIAMNARGGPGIVLATVTYDLGIISEVFFIILILTAIITSLMAGSWFSYVTGKGKVLLKEENVLSAKES